MRWSVQLLFLSEFLTNNWQGHSTMDQPASQPVQSPILHWFTTAERCILAEYSHGITPLESDIRWPRQNTFVISLVSDHNLLVEGRFIKKKVPNIRPFEKY